MLPSTSTTPVNNDNHSGGNCVGDGDGKAGVDNSTTTTMIMTGSYIDHPKRLRRVLFEKQMMRNGDGDGDNGDNDNDASSSFSSSSLSEKVYYRSVVVFVTPRGMLH